MYIGCIMYNRMLFGCREKDALWKKSDKLEYKQRLRAQVWADNDHVLNCPGCKAAFGFMLRKVRDLQQDFCLLCL